MMNDLAWCGNPALPRNTTDGIDYDSCPSKSSSCDFITPFWGQASRRVGDKTFYLIKAKCTLAL